MKQVIVLRKDLNMRKGKMIAQGAHASVKAVIGRQNDDRVKAWLDSGMTKIAVSCNSEDELLEIYQKASSKKMITSLIRDAGRTEFDGVPTLTAIAIGPGNENEINSITGELKLL